MLLCKQMHCSGIWYTLTPFAEFEAGLPAALQRRRKKGIFMSRTSAAAFHAPSPGLFGRLFATVDRLLLAYAEMTIRNGDIPRHGV
jgi:hypothetical protein